MKMSRGIITNERLRSIAIVLAGGAFVALTTQSLLSFVIPEKIHSDVNNNTSTVDVVNPFSLLPLEAYAVYVFDPQTNSALYEKNAEERLPLASVTKLMTALLARENSTQSMIITLSKDDLSTDGDSGLHPGERWRMGDLLNVMLLVSSNDAAHAISGFIGADISSGAVVGTPLAHKRFVEMMNERALSMGFSHMEFFNETGLDVSDGKNGTQALGGGYASAHEVALLMNELWKKYPETLEITSKKDAKILSQDNIAHILPNTNEIIGHIPGLVASKTGYTTIAGGNLVVIFDRGIGDPIIAVVLGSSYKGRFDDMQKIVETVYQVPTPTVIKAQ